MRHPTCGCAGISRGGRTGGGASQRLYSPEFSWSGSEEQQEDRRALPALLPLVLILQPGLCEGAPIPRRDHSNPVGPRRNARLQLLERWCQCGGSSGSPVMTRSTYSAQSSHHLAGVTVVSRFLGLFHPD